jgi:hypothetical protein
MSKQNELIFGDNTQKKTVLNTNTNDYPTLDGGAP